MKDYDLPEDPKKEHVRQQSSDILPPDAEPSLLDFAAHIPTPTPIPKPTKLEKKDGKPSLMSIALICGVLYAVVHYFPNIKNFYSDVTTEVTTVTTVVPVAVKSRPVAKTSVKHTQEKESSAQASAAEREYFRTLNQQLERQLRRN